MFRPVDPRIYGVVRRIQQTASTNRPLESFAREAGLSVSYLEKLFKEHLGLPFTRYRLRYRVHLAVVLLSLGYSITDAALKAGFSSSSHFSRTYRALTGETASQLLLKSGAHAVLERSVIREVLQAIRVAPAGLEHDMAGAPDG